MFENKYHVINNGIKESEHTCYFCTYNVWRNWTIRITTDHTHDFICHLYNTKSSVHEHGRSLHWLGLQAMLCSLQCGGLDKHISTNYMLSYATVSGFKNLFSNCLLLVCKNTADFCILTVPSVTLLKFTYRLQELFSRLLEIFLGNNNFCLQQEICN